MKKLLASLFVLLSVVVFSAEKIAIERVEVKEEKVYLKGQQTPFTGVVEKKYPNGRVEATLEVKDGKLNGKTIYIVFFFFHFSIFTIYKCLTI